MKKWFAGFVAVLIGLAAPAVAASAPVSGAGAPGSGDPFFPLAGNGGYDVSHYRLRLDYRPATRTLRGRTTITATATQALSQFDVDLRGFTVSQVLVNGSAAIWWRSGQELVVVPTAGITAFLQAWLYAPGKPASW